MSACLVESALSILKLHHRPVRLWIAAALIGILALLALSQPQFSDPTSKAIGRNGLAVLFGDPTLAIPWIWKSCLLLLPISMSVVTWLLFRLPRQGLTRARVDQAMPDGAACWHRAV